MSRPERLKELEKIREAFKDEVHVIELFKEIDMLREEIDCDNRLLINLIKNEDFLKTRCQNLESEIKALEKLLKLDQGFK